MLMLLTFLAVLSADMVSGIVASWREGQVVRSKRLRLMFGKLLSYFGTFGLTALIGLCLDERALFGGVVRLETAVALWIEALSITENMMRVFPGNSLWQWLHKVLSADYVRDWLEKRV